MNILKIYEKYHLPEILQLHMLRVAACANLIVDNWRGEDIKKDMIIRVLLLHDMGNMAKINVDEIDDKDFLKIRNKFVNKYGENPDAINVAIGKIEGLTDEELDLMGLKEARRNEEIMKSNSFETKICTYCDQRVAPYGVVPITERLEDAIKRYKNKLNTVWSNEEKARYLLKCGIEIENQIMSYCKIKPEDINDFSIQKYIDKLIKYIIE